MMEDNLDEENLPNNLSGGSVGYDDLETKGAVSA